VFFKQLFHFPKAVGLTGTVLTIESLVILLLSKASAVATLFCSHFGDLTLLFFLISLARGLPVFLAWFLTWSFWFWWYWSWTLGLVFAAQVLYHLSHAPSPRTWPFCLYSWRLTKGARADTGQLECCHSSTSKAMGRGREVTTFWICFWSRFKKIW
jgi:hypothetical protein